MGATRIGCKRDARKAVLGQLTEAGNGASRRAYLDPKGQVVYKVERAMQTSGYTTGENRRECETSSRYRDAGVPYIAPMTLWVISHNGQSWDVVASPKATPAMTLLHQARNKAGLQEPRFDDLDDQAFSLAWREYDARLKAAEAPVRETVEALWLAVNEAEAVAYDKGLSMDDMHEGNFGVAEDGSPIIFDLGHCR